MSALPTPPRRVLVSARTPDELVSWLRERRPALEFRGRHPRDVQAADLMWADAFLGFVRPKGDTLGAIRWVHCTGAGVDGWIFPNALDSSILLTRTSESFGPMIAEWVIARMLAFTQELLDLAHAQRERRWAPREVRRLSETRALVVGMGDIGRAITHRLQAFGVAVTGVARRAQNDSPLLGAVHAVSALPELVGEADWIVLAIPLTSETQGLISAELLARCRGAILLNVGRGAVVDEAALPAALDAGALRGAALDVFVREPLPATSRLWDDPRVVVSPHISGLTTVEGAGAGFLECLDALERGERPRWTVEPARGY